MQYEFIIPQCGCGDPGIALPSDQNNVSLCHIPPKMRCVKNVSINYEALGIGITCNNYCPTECDSNLYATSISTADYPTNYYSNVLASQSNLISKFSSGQRSVPVLSSGRRRRDLNEHVVNSSLDAHYSCDTKIRKARAAAAAKKNVDSGSIKQSVLALAVYFEDLNYVYILENPSMTIDTLVGLVGKRKSFTNLYTSFDFSFFLFNLS
jgi:hypothetical protein